MSAAGAATQSRRPSRSSGPNGTDACAQELKPMIDDTLLEAEEKMDKAVTVAKEDFSNIRTGRITPSVFSKITAEYYGSQTPLNQLASFHVPEPRMIVIQPY